MRALRKAARDLATRLIVAAVSFVLTLTFAASAEARGSSPPAVEITSRDGRSWDLVLKEIETDPSTLGRIYSLGVRARGSRVACGDYDLILDDAAGKAFAIDGCDVESAETRLRVVDRTALFDPGEVVPRPRSVSVSAVVHQKATAWGGGDAPTAGSRIWCSVWLQPYLLDGLRGATVPLPPDRYELVPLDERVHAAPDGSGWIAHGESHMDVYFRYEVRDRLTGKKVLEDVATLSCADRPLDPPKPPDPASSLFLRKAWPEPPTLRATPPDLGLEPPGWELEMRMLCAGVIFGASDVYQELVGLQVGLGKYTSPHWYVGATSRWVMALDQGTGDTGLTNILQAGLEMRYALSASGFHEGGAPVRTVHWLGFRGGVEDVGPGTLGSFSDIAWGADLRMHSVDLGWALGGGLAFDEWGAYGDTSVVHPYFDFTFRIAFNL